MASSSRSCTRTRRSRSFSGELPILPLTPLVQLRNGFPSAFEYEAHPHTLIVGAGPAGLATAACLAAKGIHSTVLERADCSASSWKHMTYDRLRLHLPKQFCELPLMPFPEYYPTYPTRDQFVAYLDQYQRTFGIEPIYNTTVVNAMWESRLGVWAVKAQQKGRDAAGKKTCRIVQYMSKALVVATGENAEPITPRFKGWYRFTGEVSFGKTYRNGAKYENKRVLVVGTGNSGMEIALDLVNHGAKPTLVARSRFHVMPRDLFGLNISTFGVMSKLLKVFPVWFVDKCMVFLSRLTLGDTDKYNLIRPKEGPLETKAQTGHTPVLDVGTVAKIRSGEIKVMPANVESITERGARFENGSEEDFDSIILATGYVSNVSTWLTSDGMFGCDGFPTRPFPNGWKGERGLYAVGFGRKGLMGCAYDAVRVADDIAIDTNR